MEVSMGERKQQEWQGRSNQNPSQNPSRTERPATANPNQKQNPTRKS